MSRFRVPTVLATAFVATLAIPLGAMPALAAVADVVQVQGSGLPAPLRGAGGPGVIAGQYVVVLKANVSATAAQTVRSAVGRVEAAGGMVTHRYDATISGYSATLSASELDTVRNDPAVAYVEADRRITVSGTRTAGSWGQDRIDQRSGTNGKIITAGTGAGVTVYVIDTGIRSTHKDFDGRVTAGFSSVSDSNGTEDCNGHGTHVAGTVGSDTYGVAPGVSLVPVRVLDCNGSGSSSAVIAGVEWVTAHHVANAVANLSLGGASFTALDNAVQASIDSGVTYTVAAGNSTEDACSESPARLPAAITVAASTQSDAIASFSNYGSCVDIVAPGQNIISTVNTSDTATASYSGTSMAAPHVAGAAALYLQAHPGSTPAQVSAALVGDATSGVLSGLPAGTPNLLLYVGTGTASGDSASGGAASGGAASGGAASGGSTTGSGSGTTTEPSTPATTTKPKSGKAYCRDLRGRSVAAKSSVVAGKTYTTRRAGTSYGCLTGTKKSNFDLNLTRWNGTKYVRVAGGHTSSASEAVAYTGKAGRYRWQVVLVKGSGSYSLQVAYPS